jgi:uncharacterized membrane protein YeaQ/YmgE (transglycosylase-associated protein family)
MKTINSLKMDNTHHHNDGTGGISMLIGFVLAFTNHIFGWLGNIQVTANWEGWFQAIMMGIIGSTVTFFTTKFWKYIEKKYKDRKKKD